MIIVIEKKQQVAAIENFLKSFQIDYFVTSHQTCFTIETIQESFPFDEKNLYSFDGVLSITFNQKKYLWNLKNHPHPTTISFNKWTIDPKHLTIIAGPCSVESEEQLTHLAKQIKSLGCFVFRAGAYKPRTSPYDFQGLKQEGLQLLSKIKKIYNLSVISEITSIEQIDLFVKYVDILMKHELKNALINFKTTVNLDEDTKIGGNINSLVQVINNIISNAIQAYNGKPNQEIDFILSKSNDSLIIKVQDFAGGLPKNVQEKLFKEMVTTKGKNGTGLGLFMSYSNIKAHFNGDMRYETKQGEGTTFILEIPLNKVIKQA